MLLCALIFVCLVILVLVILSAAGVAVTYQQNIRMENRIKQNTDDIAQAKDRSDERYEESKTDRRAILNAVNLGWLTFQTSSVPTLPVPKVDPHDKQIDIVPPRESPSPTPTPVIKVKKVIQKEYRNRPTRKTTKKLRLFDYR